MKRSPYLLPVVLAAFASLACATKSPVLYPNAKLEQVDQDEVDRDIATCEAHAKEYVKNPSRAERTAENTAVGGVVGGATGAAAGAVLGNVGRGAGAGAAAGAAGGLVSGIFRSRDPDPVYARFVERCLANQGYEIIGWE
jgi:uncharacterized protein YcfJ